MFFWNDNGGTRVIDPPLWGNESERELIFIKDKIRMVEFARMSVRKSTHWAVVVSGFVIIHMDICYRLIVFS